MSSDITARIQILKKNEQRQNQKIGNAKELSSRSK